MNEIIRLPFYARLTIILLCFLSLGFITYIGQDVIMPILMSFLFAVLLRPVVLFLKKRLHFPHVLAALFAVIFFVLVISGIIAFMSMQVTEIVSDLNKIERNLTIHLHNLQQYVKEHFHVSTREQNKYINDATDDSMQKGREWLASFLISFTDTVFDMILIPIYTFLILLYRTHFMMFFSKLFRKEHHEKLQDILLQIKVAVRSYIVGLILEMIAVSVLTTVGFMIIGVEYPILLGIITGVLNLIPYIGILFAGVLSIVASLTGSTDLSIVIGVIVVNVIVQLIDNNILVPMIVNSKVEINAFVSIVGIIIGGSLGGIYGMFLAIPVIAVLKVIFDRMENLEPWGYLMGDDLPKTYVWKKIKLPRYDYENSSDTLGVATTIVAPTFTVTNTKEDSGLDTKTPDLTQ
jgi:predicted PurR-regulated permease PerM